MWLRKEKRISNTVTETKMDSKYGHAKNGFSNTVTETSHKTEKTTAKRNYSKKPTSMMAKKMVRQLEMNGNRPSGENKKSTHNHNILEPCGDKYLH